MYPSGIPGTQTAGSGPITVGTGSVPGVPIPRGTYIPGFQTGPQVGGTIPGKTIIYYYFVIVHFKCILEWM